MSSVADRWDVAIRTDGGGRLGTGHVVRCCPIATALEEAGAKVGFICSDAQATDYIAEHGFPFEVDGGSFEDIEASVDRDREILRRRQVRLVVLDTLHATGRYLKGVSDLVTTCVITPELDTASAADVILNYGGYKGADYYAPAGLDGKCCLFGMGYAPLNVAYWDQERVTPSEEVSRVLVTSGGTDQPGALPAILDALDEEPVLRRVTKVVVAGRFARYERQALDEWEVREDVEVHVAPSSLLELQRSCDIAVTAAGTTIYELFALGVPAVCYALADNQHQVKALGDRIVWCGDIRSASGTNKGTARRVAHAVVDLLPVERRRELVARTSGEVDFSGARRLARELVEAIACR